MATSSSSHRKKRDKISSKARIKKRSKSKSKSEKYKSKKLRRRDDSVSYSDEDDSRSLRSDSSVSSEDDRKSRRARSRTRRDAKGGKKRSRKKSYSSEDSSPPRAKKGKVLKKDRECDPKKRNRSRKKKKTRANSVSGESRSCSSCDRSEPRTRRGRSENWKREDIDRDKVEIGIGKSASYRSRSHSFYSEGDCQNEEKGTGENNGRRLRSVIAVVKGSNEGRWLDMDRHKEVTTYDNDDYPSCRSIGSNDEGDKRELDSYLHVASEKRMRVDSAKEADARIKDFANSGNVFDKDGRGLAEGINSNQTDHRNVNEVCADVSSLKDENLETILRQKALENLKKFKGKHHTVAVMGNPEYKKQASAAKFELVQIKSPKVDNARVVAEKSFTEDVAQITDGTQLLEETNGPPVGDSICSSGNLEIELDKNIAASEDVSAKRDVCPTPQVAGAGDSEQVTSTAVVDKPNLAAPEVTLERALASEELPQETLLVTGSSVDKEFSGTPQTVTQSSDNNGEHMSNDSGSTAPEPSRENRSDKHQDEANDGSQFEQKTMSVMRGSEMVQVSYKVYIPKRAPALARRQLKR